jgi:hypothetical protein
MGEIMSWIKATEKLPTPFQTVWMTNGKGWVALGCLVDADGGYHWAQSHGIIYQEGNAIIAECESDDLDVVYWHPVPEVILK